MFNNGLWPVGKYIKKITETKKYVSKNIINYRGRDRKKKYINTKQLLLLFHSILAIISDI